MFRKRRSWSGCPRLPSTETNKALLPSTPYTLADTMMYILHVCLATPGFHGTRLVESRRIGHGVRTQRQRAFSPVRITYTPGAGAGCATRTDQSGAEMQRINFRQGEFMRVSWYMSMFLVRRRRKRFITPAVGQSFPTLVHVRRRNGGLVAVVQGRTKVHQTPDHQNLVG